MKKNIEIGINKYEINADKELVLNNFVIDTHIKSATTPTYILKKIPAQITFKLPMPKKEG